MIATQHTQNYFQLATVLIFLKTIFNRDTGRIISMNHFKSINFMYYLNQKNFGSPINFA